MMPLCAYIVDLEVDISTSARINMQALDHLRAFDVWRPEHMNITKLA